MNKQNVSGATAEGNPSRRRYDATTRRARAAESRRRIVAAAGELFAAQGYACTTLEQIAERCGLTAKLVAANGPKRDLLLAAFEQQLGGVEAAGPDEARAQAAAILAEADPEVIVERLADLAVEGQERGIGLWRALSSAAVDDPQVREAYERAAAGRQQVMRLGVDLLAERGCLRPGDRDLQAATLAMVLGFEPYQLMVLDWGWSRDRLRGWLVATIAATLVDVIDAGSG